MYPFANSFANPFANPFANTPFSFPSTPTPLPNLVNQKPLFLAPRLATSAFYINGTLHCMAFCGWLLSSTYCIHLWFTQTVALLHSFFVLLNNFPYYMDLLHFIYLFLSWWIFEIYKNQTIVRYFFRFIRIPIMKKNNMFWWGCAEIRHFIVCWFVMMLPEAHLTSHSRMAGSK